jgi:hypothetical protein
MVYPYLERNEKIIQGGKQMSKKLLSVVLALALVFSCFAVSAFAIGGLGYENDDDAAF